MLKIVKGNEGEKQRDKSKAMLLIQVIGSSDLDYDFSKGGGEKWAEPRYII